MSDYAVYIDEAGDLGIGRGTRWFVLTAVVVKKTVEPQIRARMTAIKACLNVREIHLRKITEFYKRAFIVRELRDEEFVYMNVLVDTDKFDRARIPNPIIAYNYVCKYLLQRVSWYLSSLGSSGDIVLSGYASRIFLQGRADQRKEAVCERQRLGRFVTDIEGI